MNASMAPVDARDERPVSRAVLDAAIDWQLRLDAGMGTDADRQAWRVWLAADAAHARAWRQLNEIDEQLAAARAPQARAAVLAPAGARAARRAASLLGLALIAACGAALIDRYQPVAHVLADHRTGTGERRTVILPDGSTLQLDTRSAVDIEFGARVRAVRLRAGRIAIETASGEDPQHRPFVVLTDEGSLRALGTRFTVQRLDGDAAPHAPRTVLQVQQAAVAARPARCAVAPAEPCAAERVVEAGRWAWVEGQRVGEPQPAPAEADAWREGMLVVEDRPLHEVVAELARHRPGYLAVDPAVAGLRVTGTLPLADTDRALLALTAALPVELESLTRWYAVLRPRAQAAAGSR